MSKWQGQRSESEKAALRLAIRAGADYGYGNVMQALSYAWAKTLMEKHGMSAKAALPAGRVDAAWESKPKDLTDAQAKSLLEFGESIMEGLI